MNGPWKMLVRGTFEQRDRLLFFTEADVHNPLGILLRLLPLKIAENSASPDFTALIMRDCGSASAARRISVTAS